MNRRIQPSAAFLAYYAQGPGASVIASAAVNGSQSAMQLHTRDVAAELFAAEDTRALLAQLEGN